ncbi:M23 family metallopeptidase [Halosquirtibacter xylanolyticus]|uniref:murein hydrolase activator EnvC family protein n=1 Tax=Halosquirtibacter xylanolyticus TaxID=3374599 RepID=UPI0037490A4A|nr:M23 family metallopeptidase [Prolixibacteraceae bacterium]
MNDTNNKAPKKFRDKLKDHYRVVVYHDITYHAVRQLRFSLRRFYLLVILLIIFIASASIALIAFTPIREFIPGFPSDDLRNEIIENTLAVDSLEHEIAIRDKYFRDFRRMLAGDDPVEVVQNNKLDTVVKIDSIKFKKFNHDSIFNEKIKEDKENLSFKDGNNSHMVLGSVLLFSPLKGKITSTYDIQKHQYGVQLTAPKGSTIFSTLDGTVVFSGYTVDDKYVIQIQHDNNIISVYRHNEELLKKVGDKVRAGEAIAIIGNRKRKKELPFLSFELWYKGVAVDPQLYIHFE